MVFLIKQFRVKNLEEAMAYPVPMRIKAIRGATQVSGNTSEAISSGTAELLESILKANSLDRADVISVLLTATPDLTATFPAVGARSVGFGSIPLICAVEIDVPGALERVIRVMLHCQWDRDETVSHIYLHGAASLRTDIAQ